MKKTTFTLLCLSFLLVASVNRVQAQNLSKKKYKHDDNYYEMYPNKILWRVYAAHKFEEIKFPSSGSATDIKYTANHKLNFGFGFTWRNYSLNAFYGFNNSSSDKGKTKGLDLQLHMYPHKWVIDLLAVMPKGMYIKPRGLGKTGGGYYYRPDVKERIFGVAAYRVPNKEKFSYRAALVQNEWQKKSAGSFLYGGEIYYVIGPEADSAFVPAGIQSGYPQAGVTEMRYISIGPGAGGAYTFVIDKHFFIMGSAIGNLKFNIATEEKPTGDVKKTSVAPSAIYKGAIGYNSDNWSLAASYTGNLLIAKGPASLKNYISPSGQIKVSLSKKFDLKKKKK